MFKCWIWTIKLQFAFTYLKISPNLDPDMRIKLFDKSEDRD